jgi:TolA-binding protein
VPINKFKILCSLLFFVFLSAAGPVPKLNDLNVKKQVTPELPQAKKETAAPAAKTVIPNPAKVKAKASPNGNKLESVVDREIEELNGLIKKYGKDQSLGRLQMRLAEAYGEKAHLVAYRLLEENKSPEEAIGYHLKAVAIYKDFLKEFSTNSQAPNALYLMGYNYFEAKKPKEGEAAYATVIKNYPQSQRQWDKAMELYAKVISDETQPTNLLIAKYKHAWCRYHKNALKPALDEMKSVYETAKRESSGAGVGIFEEATKALIFLYGETGQYAEAASFLKSIEKGDKLIEQLTTLAAGFRERGDPTGADFLYNEAIKLAPLHARAPYFEYELIPREQNIKEPDRYQENLAALVKKYNRDSKWAGRNGDEEPKARKFLEEKTYTWVMFNHRGLQFKTPGVTVERTLKAYDLYFTYFSDSTRADTAYYFYADLLFDNKDFNKAAGNYEKVLAKKDSTFYDQALLNAVLAYDKTLPGEDELKKVIDSPEKQIEFPASVSRFHAAATRYLAKHHKADVALPLRYRLALLEYTYKHYDDSEKSLRGLVKDSPQSEFGKNSANLILDIYERKGNYAAFVQTGKSFLGDAKLAEGATGVEIKGLTERAAFKQAQVANDTALFLAFAGEYPKSDLTGLAYYNAALNLDKTGKSNAAVENYEKALAAKDKSQYELKARKALVDLYNKLGLFHQAAEEYDQLARLTPEATDKASYFFKAGVLWFNLGKYGVAQSDLEKAMAKNPKLVTDSLEVMIDMSEAKKDFRAGVGYVSRMIQGIGQDPKRCAWLLRRARMERDGGNQKHFQTGLSETNACFDKLNNSEQMTWAAVGANAKYLLARKNLQAFKQPLSAGEEARRQKILETKIKTLDQLDEEFNRVIKLNVSEYIVKSLAAQGEAYYYVARFIEETPAPKSLEGESLNDYKAQVGQVVAKMDTQAKAFQDLAAKKSNEFKVLAFLSVDGKVQAPDVSSRAQFDTKDVFN